MTPPAASPTQNVKLAMYSPQLTWSDMLVTIMPSRTWTDQALAPTSAIAVSKIIQPWNSQFPSVATPQRPPQESGIRLEHTGQWLRVADLNVSRCLGSEKDLTHEVRYFNTGLIRTKCGWVAIMADAKFISSFSKSRSSKPSQRSPTPNMVSADYRQPSNRRRTMSSWQ